MDELPTRLGAVAAHPHEQAARAQDLEHGHDVVGGVFVADHREQLGLGAHRALVMGRDERDEQVARDEVAAVGELGVDHALEVLADDRLEPAELAVVRERQRGVTRIERFVEDRARELEVRWEHGAGGAPPHLGADRGGGAL